MLAMDLSRIAGLLQPFAGSELAPDVLHQIDTYLDLLVRWNARMNLTAIRDPDEMVTRHFGESLFAARQLIDRSAPAVTIADVGSGAGFPGVPMKLWAPLNRFVLIESQHKKATFLREVVRTLKLDGVEVICERAEQWGHTADLVSLRAVERFDRVLPVAAKLVSPGGKMGLLIGSAQFTTAQHSLGNAWTWRDPTPVPQSRDRILAVASLGA